MARFDSSRVLNRRATAAVLAAIVAAACSTPPSSSSSSAPGATKAAPPASASSPGAFTAITRNIHPLAKPQFDLGHRDPSIPTAGSIYFQPTRQQMAARDALVAAVQDPVSPAYHKWLAPEDFAARFGAQPADIARVTKWLEAQGLTIDAPSPLGTRVGFRGTSGQVETAFRTEFHEYLIGRTKHYAMATAPQVPTELAPVVMGLRGFHDFHPHPMNAKPRPRFKDPGTGLLTLGPADFQALYDTKSLISAGTDGAGINIAIIGQTWIVPSDIAAFRSQFGITRHETDILVPGTGPQFVTQGDPGEAELDLEWSSAAAPGANIIYVYVGEDQPNFSVNDSVVYVVEQGTKLAPGVGNGGAQVMSESYGGCDLGDTSVDADVDSEIAAAANLEGITYVAASGDDGSQGCNDGQGDGIGLYTGPPADLPGVTAVGGTEFCSGPASANGFGCSFSATPPNAQVSPYFNLTSFAAVEYPQPAGGASLESVWNDSMAAPAAQGGDYWSAGGGAPSIIFPKPFYQYGPTPNDGARDVPDVSLTASPNNVGFEIYEQGAEEDGGTGLGIIGGTSAATPSFAGILAMVNQAVVAAGGPPGLGNINPMLYAMQATSSTSDVFHDIVTGNNAMPCVPDDAGAGDPGCPGTGTYGGFNAGPGYDLASGLGSVDGAKLVAAWSALTPTKTTVTVPAAATVGAPVTISATVSSTATANPIGGTISFTFETFAGSAGQSFKDAGLAPIDGGVQDESWLLGTVDVTPGAGTPETATAQLSVAIPPGLYGNAYVVAMYNGNTQYLASHSATSLVTVAGSNLVLSPTTKTVAPFGHTTFTAAGGAPPYTWNTIGTDSTCDVNFNCTFIEPESPTSVYAQAGATVGGTATVIVIDTNGEEATAKITVEGAPVDAGTFPTFDAGPSGGPPNPAIPDSGAYQDSGQDAGPSEDAAPTQGVDSSVPTTDSGSVEPADASPTTDAGSAAPPASSGCGCVTAGRSGTETHTGILGGVLFGLAAFGRRRRSRR
jgi:hypothetical protein